MASLKRSGSKSLEDLWGPCKKSSSTGHKQAGSRANRGLGGLQRTSSLDASGATGGGSGSVAGACRGPPEVCSPPPSKPLNFAAPDIALSPFAAATVAAVTPVPPVQLQQSAPGGGSRRQGASKSSEAADAWEPEEDRENQQPRACCDPAAPPANDDATWLVSPVRPRPKARGATAPVPIPGAAGLLSPGGHMPTPAKEAGSGAAAAAPTPTLHHAPSFSSWMVPAARPPLAPAAPPAGVDVADVLACLAPPEALHAPRGFGGAPSHLDRLLAELGDSHYPASLMAWEREELPDSDAERF